MRVCCCLSGQLQNCFKYGDTDIGNTAVKIFENVRKTGRLP